MVLLRRRTTSFSLFPLLFCTLRMEPLRAFQPFVRNGRAGAGRASSPFELSTGHTGRTSSSFASSSSSAPLSSSLAAAATPPSLPDDSLGGVTTTVGGLFDFEAVLSAADLQQRAATQRLSSIAADLSSSLQVQVKSLQQQQLFGAMEDPKPWEQLRHAIISSSMTDGTQSSDFFIQDVPEKFQSFIEPVRESIESGLLSFLGPTNADFGGAAAATTLMTAGLLSYVIVSALFSAGQAPPPSSPYPLGNRYDAEAAYLYFSRRVPRVLTRGLQIGLQSAAFAAAVLLDRLHGKAEEREFQRGRELAELLTRLGPTFIKVGQSLSIRRDLLSKGYLDGLATLQDQVPAFSTREARQILEGAWGRPVTDVLTGDLTPEPVAAASLGQVYRATLRSTGQEVAIKVQRPDILETIALDMFLLRSFGAVLKNVMKLNTDTVGTADEWGAGFVDELDYEAEAENARFFSEQIKNTPLKDVVFAPDVVDEYSTDKVLVTQWVDGERLDKSSKDDVTILCSIAMNTYLTMLLEIGVLHCDPHPGNLLRTPDGRLCLLDWGMVTKLDQATGATAGGTDLQRILIEHVAHLTSGDYKEVPRDLLLLGFIPEDKADLVEDSGVVETLADIYSAWTSGGGAAAINVNQVVSRMQDLTAQKGNLFRLPPYFAYIAKSFSVLEGIGLTNDPKYSIVNECLPYISKRLLTDKEAMGPALSSFIFGPNKENWDRIVDYKRVEQLVEGFDEYTTSASGALLGKEDLSRTELMEDAAEQILDLVITEEDTPLQQILLEQLAKIVTAGGRTVFERLRERSGTLPSGRTVLGTMVDPLGVWRTSPLVRTNDLDAKTIEMTRKLLKLTQKQIQNSNNPLFDVSTLSREESLALSSILVRKIWQRRIGVLKTGNRFARILLGLTAKRLELGERDSRTLPSRPESEENPSLPPAEEWSKNGPVSPRLESARQLLKDLQEDKSVPAMPEAVPVKTD